MSDGPWGVDDSQEDSQVYAFEVLENTEDFNGNDYGIERNISIKATTQSYVGVYRALTPRFMPVDLSDHNTLKFKARGAGSLEVTLIKHSIQNWEDQYKTTIQLTDELSVYELSKELFITANGQTDPSLDDIKTIVFNLVASSGSPAQKELEIQQLRFTTLTTTEASVENPTVTKLINYPNPFAVNTTIVLPQTSKSISLLVFDTIGRLVDAKDLQSTDERNFTYESPNLTAGIYKYQVLDDKGRKYIGSFMIQ